MDALWKLPVYHISFPLKIVIGTEQIGSGDQKYTGWQLTGLSGFVGPISGPGFQQDG